MEIIIHIVKLMFQCQKIVPHRIEMELVINVNLVTDHGVNNVYQLVLVRNKIFLTVLNVSWINFVLLAKLITLQLIQNAYLFAI